MHPFTLIDEKSEGQVTIILKKIYYYYYITDSPKLHRRMTVLSVC